jgi:hypothetical protein
VLVHIALELELVELDLLLPPDQVRLLERDLLPFLLRVDELVLERVFSLLDVRQEVRSLFLVETFFLLEQVVLALVLLLMLISLLVVRSLLLF